MSAIWRKALRPGCWPIQRKWKRSLLPTSQAEQWAPACVRLLRGRSEKDLLVTLDQLVLLVRNDVELFHAAAHRKPALRITLSAFPQHVEKPFFWNRMGQLQPFGTQERQRNDPVITQQFVIELQVLEAD